MATHMSNLLLGLKIAILAMTMTFAAMVLIIVSTKLLMKFSREEDDLDHVTAPLAISELKLALISAAVVNFLTSSKTVARSRLVQSKPLEQSSLSSWKYSTRVSMMRDRHDR
ncbi:MAG: hypothetical protein ACE5OZ_22365 [Candidatus Heimdallarchaeota archaeon]